MYELIMEQDGRWSLIIMGKVYAKSSFSKIIRICLKDFKFNSLELDMAIKELCDPKNNDHDTAHFGVYKNLIYTYNRKETKKAM